MVLPQPPYFSGGQRRGFNFGLRAHVGFASHQDGAKYSDGAGEFIQALARQHASPLAALRAYADCMAGMAASPAALARGLAYLQIDMTDPDFRRQLVKQARATRAGLRRLVEAAFAAGKLDRSAKPRQLARTIETVLSGSMITRGFYREGNAARWMRADLDAVLATVTSKTARTSAWPLTIRSGLGRAFLELSDDLPLVVLWTVSAVHS